MLTYDPVLATEEIPVVNQPSAWKNFERIIPSLIRDFNIIPNRLLEFGVDYGYSTSAFAHFFKQVIGVDLFKSGDHGDRDESIMFDKVSGVLKSYPNIKLVKQNFYDYIKTDNSFYDVIHIDIDHSFEPTYNCGEWAVRHARVVLFHDTNQFILNEATNTSDWSQVQKYYSPVRKACCALAALYNYEFYNYDYVQGLGILVKK